MRREALDKLNFSGRPKLPVIRQNEAAECALACLAMVASYHGYRTDISSLRRKFPVSLKGVTLKMLMEMADESNLAPRALRVELSDIGRVETPAILHWDMNHFVVLKAVSRNSVSVHDPAIGARRYTLEEFSRHFTGVALELRPTDRFKRREVKAKLRLSDMWSNIVGLKRNLLHAIVLSIVLQLFVLASPFYLQLTIDEVLINFDIDLLLVLALGFGGFTLINAAAEALRGYVLLYISNLLGYQMVLNLFNHLIHLPLPFFEKRHIGDLVSRFSSTKPIRHMLTEGLVATFIDGLMAITTVIVMFIYSPTLAAIALAALFVYLFVRLSTYRLFRQRSEDAIVFEAKEATNFMETVRGMATIKLFGRESDRQRFWQNHYADVINADVKVGKLNIWFQVSSGLIFGIELVILIYVAARMVLQGDFTVGMIFAFMAYKRHFTEKASTLVERAIEFRMLGLHLDRLSDIALATREHVDSAKEIYDEEIMGDLEVDNVSFSYAKDEPDVLNKVSFSVTAGETVAIVGPSGCGKTTLLKIMLGLFRPNDGEIRVDGVSLEQYGLASYRHQIAAVMQDDRLFAGSIAENIAFFDTDIDMGRVVQCARRAFIHDEIMVSPMAYNSLVGDMGTTLSGGQIQRVMLARALYQKPRILFMDEGTAHLDVNTEKLVNTAIANLGITRIIIAHRPETIGMADRVYSFRDGRWLQGPSSSTEDSETRRRLGNVPTG